MTGLSRLLPYLELQGMLAPSAPRLCLAFATWKGRAGWSEPISPYSAGKGATPELAAVSCLGEMAENLSIGVAAHRGRTLEIKNFSGKAICYDPQDALVRNLEDPTDLGSEGCAAGETLEDAIRAAMCERIERAAVHDWWVGKEQAQPIAEAWTRDTGFRAYEAFLRAGNPENRALTRLFYIGEELPFSVILCMASANDGSEVALGFAAALDPIDAARRSLEEAILQEIPLLAARGKPNGHLSVEEISARRRSQFVQTNIDTLAAQSERQSPDGSSDMATAMTGLNAGYVDLTSETIAVSVVRALVPDLPLCRPLTFDDRASPL